MKQTIYKELADNKTLTPVNGGIKNQTTQLQGWLMGCFFDKRLIE
jgi:hypothetical protein